MTQEHIRVEEFQVSGDDLLAKVKELLREGNIRRVTVRDEKGRTRFDIPLTLAVAGALVKPKLIALAAIAAVCAHATVVIERVSQEAADA